MSKFALTKTDDGRPISLFIERPGTVEAYGANSGRQQAYIDEEKTTTVRGAMSGGYDYYETEVGEYSGANKKRIDKIAEELGKEDRPKTWKEIAAMDKAAPKVPDNG